MVQKIKTAILGASGYTGAELLRLLQSHPHVEIALLSAERKAGLPLADVFGQFTGLGYPDLISLDEAYVRVAEIDLVFCALPHGTTQEVIAKLFEIKPSLKVIDLSADFRLSVDEYPKWYGHEHYAPHLQGEAVFGLTEITRQRVQGARLVANPGCHSTVSILSLWPLAKAHAIDLESIIIDSKTGVTGAGRAAKEANLYAEVGEGMHAYSVGKHRHMAEIDMVLSEAAGVPVRVSFTPHLIPISRGMLVTAYLKLAEGQTAQSAHALLDYAYASEPFVTVLPFGQTPQTRHVRGTNRMMLGLVADPKPDRIVVVGVIDNLAKGASGQAVQNMNVVYGWPEMLGLERVALFP